jgi:hypothetical protein
MAGAAQRFRHVLLLQVLAQRQEGAVEAAGVIERAGNGVQDLLARPCVFVPSEIEDALDQAGLLPPRTQVMQQRALARAAHAADQQNVPAVHAEQPLLDAQDIDVPADKAVGRLMGAIPRLLLPQPSLALLRRKLAERKVGGFVLVDHRQQPVLQQDLLIVIGAAVLDCLQLAAGKEDRPVERRALDERAVELRHHRLGGADRDRVGHAENGLHPRLHQPAGEARFRIASLLAGLAGVENDYRNAVGQQQALGHLAGLGRIGPRFTVVVVRGAFFLEEKERFLALVGRQVRTAVAGPEDKLLGLAGFLEFLVREQRPVQIEVDDVIKAGALLLQMLGEGTIGAGPDDVDVDRKARGAQRFNERAGDGAVADIALDVRAGGGDEEVDGRRGRHPGRVRLRLAAAPHHRRVEAERLRQVRIFQRLPVQAVELR